MRAYERYFIRTVPLKHRFAIILGERGVGKTTTLIQYLLKTTDGDQLSNDILYVQADHLLIGTTTLYEIARELLSYVAGNVSHRRSPQISKLVDGTQKHL